MNSYEKIVEYYNQLKTSRARLSEPFIMATCKSGNKCLTEDNHWIPEKVCGREYDIAMFFYGIGRDLSGLKEEFEEDGVI